MYYEEQVIDGILHYKTTPNSKWESFSLTMLTNKYIQAQLQVIELNDMVDELIQDGCTLTKSRTKYVYTTTM